MWPDRSMWVEEGEIEAARAGDTEALTRVVAAAHPHVLRFAHSLCASQQDAEDAAQEALWILYRRLGSLRATSALASWVFQIVRHECMRRVRALRHLPLVDHDQPAPDETDLAAIRLVEAQQVASAIASLPLEFRDVLVLRDLRQWGGDEVAAELGLSSGAMKSRLHRARAALRVALEQTAA